MGMDIHRIWTWSQFFAHGFFYGWARTASMDMDMDLILVNPIQTRPIAILSVHAHGHNADLIMEASRKNIITPLF